MKSVLMIAMIYEMIFPSFVFADADSSCKLSDAEVSALNLTSGTTRLELLSKAATVMENPNASKVLGDPANAQSVGMSGLTRLYGAALLTANEEKSHSQAAALLGRCNENTSLNDSTVASNLQRYAQACSVYSLVNKVVALIADMDTLTKNNILAKATANAATAEKIKRDGEIKKEKEKVTTMNKEIKLAIAEIDKAKKEQKKAAEDLAKANQALAAANATDCTKDESGDCEKSKGAAVAAASKAVAEATKKNDEAVKKLKKIVAKMIDLLTTKYGVEARAVLAILSGTAVGDADGKTVNFRVAGNDFQLVDLNKTISGLTGDSKEKAGQFLDSPMAGDNTINFFGKFMDDIASSANKDSPLGADLSKARSTESLLLTSEDTSSFLSVRMPDVATTREILAGFGNAENGADYIATLGLALVDYSESKATRKLDILEENKTPESRIAASQGEMDKNNALINDLKKMIDQGMCYLDKSLMLYKEFYKATKVNETEDPFYLFVYNFTTDALKKKIKEGLSSTVNYKGIQAAFECYAKGGNSGSCTITPDATPGGQCHWNGAVIGPTEPPTEVCDMAHLGQIIEHGGTLQCVCD